MTAALAAQVEGINAAISRFQRIAGWKPEEGARRIAPILESQTRRRIEVEKTTPAGRKWAPNKEGTSILMRTGRNLRDSISSRSAGADAIVEAHWRYAHVHQKGMTIVPRNKSYLSFLIGKTRVFAKKVTIQARQFMGLSAENESDIVAELEAMLAAYGGGAAP